VAEDEDESEGKGEGGESEMARSVHKFRRAHHASTHFI